MILVVGVLLFIFGGSVMSIVAYALGWGTMDTLGPSLIVSVTSIHLAALINGYVLIFAPMIFVGILLFIFNRDVFDI